jgi:hypothetical protein
MQYARLIPNTETVETFLELDPAYVAALSANKRALLKPVVSDPMPTAGPAQVVESRGYVVEANQIRQTWGVREKTADELKAEADAAEREQLKASAILDLLKAEAAGTSTLTAAQSRKLFGRCLVWLVNR